MVIRTEPTYTPNHLSLTNAAVKENRVRRIGEPADNSAAFRNLARRHPLLSAMIVVASVVDEFSSDDIPTLVDESVVDIHDAWTPPPMKRPEPSTPTTGGTVTRNNDPFNEHRIAAERKAWQSAKRHSFVQPPPDDGSVANAKFCFHRGFVAGFQYYELLAAKIAGIDLDWEVVQSGEPRRYSPTVIVPGDIEQVIRERLQQREVEAGNGDDSDQEG